MAAKGFCFEGVKYEMSRLMLAEAREIQKVTGLTVVQWEKALGEADAFAITALIWISRRRDPEQRGLRFDDVDGDLSTFEPFGDDDDGQAEVGEPGKGEAESSTAGAPSAEA